MFTTWSAQLDGTMYAVHIGYTLAGMKIWLVLNRTLSTDNYLIFVLITFTHAKTSTNI